MLINIYIVFSATSSATNLTKTVAKNSYSLLEYLHGMQGVRGSNPLGSIEQLLKLNLITCNLEVRNKIETKCYWINK